MIKRTFHYCATHKADEAYMRQMCARGWAATGLIEGVWTFEPCEPNAYCYRVCYLRGKSREETEALKARLAARGIQFVSQYSFWAIFRSTEEFTLYSAEEDREICRKIYAPMPIGAAVSWLLVLAFLLLTWKCSFWFVLPAILIGLYGAICTWLAGSYHKLLKTMQ